MPRFVYLFILLFSPLVFAGKITIKSQPDAAEIFIIDGASKPVSLGKTPYESDLEDIIRNYVKSSSFLIELKKDGHEPYRVLVAKTANVDMALTATLELSQAITNIKEHDFLMNELFDVQKLIRARNFTDAINKLEDLEKRIHVYLSFQN